MLARRCVARRFVTGAPCGAQAAVGDRCWTHGAAGVVPPLALTLDGGTPILWHSDETGEKLGKPRPASKWAASKLVASGVIRHGFFVVDNRDRRQCVDKFIRRLERTGARCVPLLTVGPVRRYRFEAQSSQTEGKQSQ